MIETINGLDAAALLWLNSLHNSFFDIFMPLASNKWIWTPMYFAIFAICTIHNGFKPKLAAILLLFGAAFTLSDFTCAEIIRPLFNRPRPSNEASGISHLVHIIDGYRGGSYGFPSCHASNSYMLATLCMLVFRNKRLTIFMFLWATLHSYSRIYLGVHYPGDIITGGIIGSLISVACYKVYAARFNISEEKPVRYLAAIQYTGLAILLSITLYTFAAQYCS